MSIRAAVPYRVERLCKATLSATALREQVLAEIGRALAFDAHVWLLTDPVTRVGTAPLAHVPGLPRLSDLARWRYLTRLNRWTDLMDAGTHVASLHEVTGGHLAASAVWREVQRPLGVVDVAVVVFWDRFGCWAWLELWRCAPSRPFEADDLAYLSMLAAGVTAGLRRAHARTFVPGVPDLGLRGPAVLVLTPDLQVRAKTPPAVEAIAASAYDVAAALVAEERGVPVGAPWSRIHLGHGRWLRLRAARVPTDDGDGDIAVSFEDSTLPERVDMFARAHGLSGRERQVLAELATGADTRTTGRRLSVSENTVDDLVRAILAKTGSATRRALLSRIAGAGGTGNRFLASQ